MVPHDYEMTSNNLKQLLITARVHYYDTDSCLVLLKTGKPLEKARKVLKVGSPAYGFYKDEIDGDLQMESFASLGPKNLSYRLVPKDPTSTKEASTVVKVRGFTLKSAMQQECISHEGMTTMLKAFVEDKEKQQVEIKMFQMQSNRKDQTVSNYVCTKNYRNDSYNKRMILDMDNNPDFTTVPYGAKHLNFVDLL